MDLKLYLKDCAATYDRAITQVIFYLLLAGATGHLQFIFTGWPAHMAARDGQQWVSVVSAALFLYGAYVARNAPKPR